MGPATKEKDESDSETELVMGENEEVGNQSQEEEEQSEAETDPDGSESRRKEALDHMARIEKEFAELKDRLYQEKMAGLTKESQQLTEGTHPEYIDQMNQIEKTKNEKLHISKTWRDLLIKTVENTYKTECEAIENELAAEKESLNQRLMATLQEKKKKLEEEKNNMDISFDFNSSISYQQYLQQNKYQSTRKLRSKKGELDLKTLKRQRLTTGPQIVHTLTEPEIVEDIYLIRKGLPSGLKRNAVKSVPKN
jgi:hypothetical protein